MRSSLNSCAGCLSALLQKRVSDDGRDQGGLYLRLGSVITDYIKNRCVSEMPSSSKDQKAERSRQAFEE